MKNLWINLSVKTKAIVVVIAVALIALVITGGNGGGRVTSEDEAIAAVEKIFPEKEYRTEYKMMLNPCAEMYDVGIGKWCGDCWTGAETIEAYVVAVQNIKSPQYT